MLVYQYLLYLLFIYAVTSAAIPPILFNPNSGRWYSSKDLRRVIFLTSPPHSQ